MTDQLASTLSVVGIVVTITGNMIFLTLIWHLQTHGTPKQIKGSKERYLLGQKHNLQIFGVIPFIKLQNYT